MPLYEYECEVCGGRFELIRKFSDPPLETCTICGKSPVQRLMSSPAIQFKGSGWYITDYAQKGKAGSDGAKGASSKDKSDTASSADSAAKSDTTTAKTSASQSSTGDTKN